MCAVGDTPLAASSGATVLPCKLVREGHLLLGATNLSLFSSPVNVTDRGNTTPLGIWFNAPPSEMTRARQVTGYSETAELPS